jgi:hypothetical protein
MNWLRRFFGKLERRWIPDPKERKMHDELVRERLGGGAVDAEELTGTADRSES